VVGLNHEQQHQELALTDIKHAFFSNPLFPSYTARSLSEQKDSPVSKLTWHSFGGGLVEIGYPLRAEDPRDFCFDNETPRHNVFLEPFQIANREVTCREYLEFISDDAYARPESGSPKAGITQSARPGRRLCTGGVILAIRPAGACSH
jgi:formylglycine-generating enzyme required for sulfatase activity